MCYSGPNPASRIVQSNVIIQTNSTLTRSFNYGYELHLILAQAYPIFNHLYQTAVGMSDQVHLIDNARGLLKSTKSGYATCYATVAGYKYLKKNLETDHLYSTKNYLCVPENFQNYSTRELQACQLDGLINR